MLPATRHLTLVIILTLLIPIIPFAVIGELPGERWLSATDNNSWLFGLVGAGILTSDILLPVPSSIIGTMLGARLGFLPGWFLTWLGLMLGNLIGYYAGRFALSRFGSSLPQTPTVLLLLMSRPVPIVAEAAAFTAGASRMKLSQFLFAAVIGNGIYACLLAGNGAALLPDLLIGPGLILPMLLPVVAWLIWRRFAAMNRTLETET